jgi:hypothetical protein
MEQPVRTLYVLLQVTVLILRLRVVAQAAEAADQTVLHVFMDQELKVAETAVRKLGVLLL